MTWEEFLSNHNASRGEMDAGMLFGSDAAPECRVKEITQVAYRLNLIRPESVLIDSGFVQGLEFVGFFVSQMVPSIKAISGRFSDQLQKKFADISFSENDSPSEYDMLWWRGESFSGSMSRAIARMNQGGIAVVESILDRGQKDGFKACLYLGHGAEVIIDRSECDVVESLVSADRPVPKTRYVDYLQRPDLGGYGIIYT